MAKSAVAAWKMQNTARTSSTLSLEDTGLEFEREKFEAREGHTDVTGSASRVSVMTSTSTIVDDNDDDTDGDEQTTTRE